MDDEIALRILVAERVPQIGNQGIGLHLGLVLRPTNEAQQLRCRVIAGARPLAQIALNWCAQKDFVSTCIVGAQHRKKVFQNAAAFDWSLTADEMAALDAAIDAALG